MAQFIRDSRLATSDGNWTAQLKKKAGEYGTNVKIKVLEKHSVTSILLIYGFIF